MDKKGVASWVLILIILAVFALGYVLWFKDYLSIGSLIDAPTDDSAQILPTSCVDEPEGKAVITTISKTSGTIGDEIEIGGCNFSGFEGDKNVWIENPEGKKGILRGEDGSTDKLIKVILESPLCSEDNSYSGLPCSSYLELTPGQYKMWIITWGEHTKSNEVFFTIK